MIFFTQTITLAKTKPGVDYTNNLCATFTQTDPKSAKVLSQGISLFLHFLGSGPVKASREILTKTKPGFVEQI